MPVEQTELEKKIRELTVKQTELEKENREFKQLLSGGKFREGGENRKSTVTFLDVESRNSIDITAENDHAPGSGHIGQVQLYPDVKEIPSKADDEVEPDCTSLEDGWAENSVTFDRDKMFGRKDKDLDMLSN